MDTKIGMEVKKLIEVDRRAVDLSVKREAELKELERKHKIDMERIGNSLQDAKDEAKMTYTQIVESAEVEAKQLDKEIGQRLQNISQGLTQAISGLADELWGKIQDNMK